MTRFSTATTEGALMGVGLFYIVAFVIGDGLPGYRYTYTYRDDDGGQGAHVHYFLFKADRLIQIVLQAVPATKLAELQPTFDEVAGSFRKGGG